MGPDFTRRTLVALLALALASCATSEESEQKSQTSEISGVQSACNFSKFSSPDASPCAFNGLPRTADLVVQTTPERAREECTKLADFASSQVELRPRWILQITSPALGDGYCMLGLPNLSDVPTSLWPVIEEVFLFAISISPKEGGEFLDLMIGMLEQMRAHLAEVTDE